MRRVVPLIAALALLAGCSSTTGGSATPAGSGSTSTGQTSGSKGPTSTSEEPSKRPKTINVEGVDPCGLLTEAQRAELGLNRPPQKEEQPGKASCSISREDRKYTAGVFVNTNEGIETFTEGPQAGEPTRLEVGGFPAVMRGATTALGLVCTVSVDVADGQRVDVQASSLGDTDVPGLCQVAQPIAAAVIVTLNK